MLSVIHASHVLVLLVVLFDVLFNSNLVSFHLDGFTTFLFEWLDTIGAIESLEAAQWANEEDHEDEEDGGGDHSITELSRKACQIIDEWRKTAFLWWTLLNGFRKVEHGSAAEA